MSPRTAPRTAAPAGAHAGQALVESLLIIRQAAGRNAPPIGTTTAAAPVYSYPANDAQCAQGRWATYVTPEGTFKDQGDCVSWVATNGRNAPARTPTP